MVNISVTNKWPQVGWHMAVSRPECLLFKINSYQALVAKSEISRLYRSCSIGIVGTTTGATACDGPPSMPTATADSGAALMRA